MEVPPLCPAHSRSLVISVPVLPRYPNVFVKDGGPGGESSTGEAPTPCFPVLANLVPEVGLSLPIIKLGRGGEEEGELGFVGSSWARPPP